MSHLHAFHCREHLIASPTVTGTNEERGIIAWRKLSTDSAGVEDTSRLHIYDIPYLQDALDRVKCFHYIPCCPSFLRHRTKTPPKDDVIEIKTVDASHDILPQPTQPMQYNGQSMNHQAGYSNEGFTTSGEPVTRL